MIALVSCVASKRDHACAAQDLYVSPLFRAARRYAEAQADQWFILSAEHGLLSPTEIVVPYNRTLNTMPRAERQVWAEHVLSQLTERLPGGSTLALMAGKRYREQLVAPLVARGHLVPELETWRLGIGSQLRWYAEHRGIAR